MGLPKILTSDQGGEFRSDLDKRIMALLKIKHHFTTLFSSNSIVTIIIILVNYVQHFNF